MATVLRHLSLQHHFQDFLGTLFDVDGSLLDCEGPQEELWKNGVHTVCNLEVHDGEIVAHITHCFQSGQFGDLVPGIFNRLVSTGKIPDHIRDSQEFDLAVTAVRQQLMLDLADKGEIRLLPGVSEALLIFRNSGMNRGLYTNSPQVLSQPLCEKLLGRELFNQAIPPGGRIYGYDVKERKKPDPLGWEMAQERIGTPRNKTLIVEDRPINIKRAMEVGFGGAIGICDGHPERFLEMLGRDPHDNIYLIQDWRSLRA